MFRDPRPGFAGVHSNNDFGSNYGLGGDKIACPTAHPFAQRHARRESGRAIQRIFARHSAHSVSSE
jgi:hypothetical protein